MPSFTHRGLQSEPYVEKLLATYDDQSYLPHVELPKLPSRPRTNTASISNGNSDSDSDRSTESTLDYCLAVNSAVCTALLVGHKDVVPTLRQIRSSLTTQSENSSLIRESLERKIDNLTNKVDETSYALEKMTDNFEKRMGNLEEKMDDLAAGSKNQANRSLNMRRYKLFHKIELITSRRYNQKAGKCQWWAHPSFPKHLKAFRNLGNHAKGQWTPLEQQLSNQQREENQRVALAAINDLCEFYATNVVSDERSESEATEVIMRPENVDDFMEALGDSWGLDWEMVSNILDEETQQQSKKRRRQLLGYDTEQSPSSRLRME